jgi:hypothetical protein
MDHHEQARIEGLDLGISLSRAAPAPTADA